MANDLVLNSGSRNDVPLTELFVEFRGGSYQGEDELLMEFYATGLRGSLYPCLCGRRVAQQPEPKPYWLVYPDFSQAVGSEKERRVVTACHNLLESLIHEAEPYSLIQEGLGGAKVHVEQITRQCVDPSPYHRTMWWSWISLVRFEGTPVFYRKCPRCTTVVLVGSPES